MPAQAITSNYPGSALLTVCDKLTLHVLNTYGGGWLTADDVFTEVWNLVNNRRTVAGLKLELERVCASLYKFHVLSIVKKQHNSEFVASFRIGIFTENRRGADAVYTLLDNIEHEFIDNGYFTFENCGAEAAYNILVEEARRYNLARIFVSDYTHSSLETVYEQRVEQELTRLT